MESLAILSQNTTAETLQWDASIQGQKIWPRKTVLTIFASVTSTEGTPLLRGKGHFF